MSTDTSKTELNVLFPLGKEVTVADKTLTITPFKLGELPSVFKHLEPISAALFSSLGDGSIAQMDVMIKLIGDGGENIIDLMHIGSRQPREWVVNLDIDAGIDLFTVILEVNSDFFIHKVLPKLNRQMDQIKQKVTPGQEQ